MEKKQKSVKTCPQCHSLEIKKKISGLTVIVLAVIWLVLSYSTASPPRIQAMLAFMGIGLLAIIYAVNKNKCKTCGHRWR